MPKTMKKCKTEQVEEPVAEKSISTIDPSVVLNNVLCKLGKPTDMTNISPNLTRATAIKQNQFRVNVFQRNPLRLSDTFFVWVNENGGIVKSIPEIIRKY